MADLLDAAGGIPPAASRSDPPIYDVVIWPHRSMNPLGFRLVMAGAALMLCIPMIPVIGTPVFFGLAPFALGAWGLLWLFLKRNYRDARLSEHLRLWPDLIQVDRREPRGPMQTWHANPYWVELKIHPDARPEQYITLRGNGRTIQLGAFLSPEERLALHEELAAALQRARVSPDAAPSRPEEG